MTAREQTAAASVGEALEQRARKLVRQDEGLSWGLSGGAATRRELALVLDELAALRREHTTLDAALRERGCELGTARFALERLYTLYDPARMGARERLRESQARVDAVRLEAEREHAQHVRRVHRELLRLLSEHAALEGWGGR